MSKENVEIVRAAFEAWNAGDMEALRELYDPDVILRSPDGWPEPGPFVGREAVMRQFEQMRETWDADALEPISDFIDAADRVVVRMIWHGAGHGPEADLELTTVDRVRKDRVVFIEYFWDHAEALETLGLSEYAMSENVERLRVAHEAFRAGKSEFGAELLDPEIEWDVSGAPTPDIGGVYRGVEGVREFWREWLAAWETVQFEYELLDAGDRVVGLIDERMRRRSTANPGKPGNVRFEPALTLIPHPD